MVSEAGRESSRSDRQPERSDPRDGLIELRTPLAGDVPLRDLIDPKVRPGELYEPLGDGALECYACGHRCKVKPGRRGICQVRYNVDGELHVPWGYVAALQCDPTEKKPFFHVYPGSDTLTFGMLGCDLHCPYCQNWDTSQALRDAEARGAPHEVSPAQLVDMAQRNCARCVASSYNEPLITSEWAGAVFEPAKRAGLTTMYVSNGNATPEVLEYLQPLTDAYKIDLKTMNDKNYRQLGAVLERVLEGARMVHDMGYWLEIVTLVIPGFNDSESELRSAARFIRSLSPNVPWHVTAFHKDYRMTDPDNTSAGALIRAAKIGYEEGLHFVYAGNLPGRVEGYEHTYCPGCGEALVERFGYVVLDYKLTEAGTCPSCKGEIPGIWPESREQVRLGSPNELFFRRPRPVR